MSFIDSPTLENPEPGRRTVAELLTALREVEDSYEFQRLWGRALAAASSPDEREQVLLTAAARLDQVSARVSGSAGSARLWLRQLSREAAARGGVLPESLARATQEVVRSVVYQAEADIAAWREAVATERDVSEFIRRAPRSVASLRDLGRVLERLRGTGVLSLVDSAVVDEIVEFYRLVTNGEIPRLGAVGDWMRVSRDVLLQWAGGPEAKHQLPLLVRRLVRETGSGVVTAHFLAGSAVTTGGWDGTVEAAGESPFVPAGRSGWELSVEQGAQGKAETDFEARIQSVPEGERHDMTFIELICRQWTKAPAFESDARARGAFRDVRAYNVDHLEEWLEHAPATSVFFWELVGRPLDGVSTITDHWRQWLESARPVLDSPVVLAGRASVADDIRSYANAGPGITTVGGNVRLDEILAFFGAVWAASGDDSSLGELLVVSDDATGRRIMQATSPLVLLATSPELLKNLPPASPNRVFVAVPGGTRVDVSLPPVEQRGVSEYLRQQGIEFYLAGELGSLARRSLLALRRRLAVQPELYRPAWAQSPVPMVLRRSLLVGVWHRGIAADRDALERLVGEEYTWVEEALRAYADVGDPFVSLVDERWHVVSPVDAWLLVGTDVSDDDLAAFSDLAVSVLTDVDPLASLPPEQRWRASIEGVQPSYSSHLRTGVARSLAILGSLDLPLLLGQNTAPSSVARATVRRALEAASEDDSFRVWRVVASELPLLVEAAPSEVIEALESGIASAPELMRQMFTDEEAGVFGASSSHTEFLWALERLAWSVDYFADAVDLLAELHNLDPGGRLLNRPAESVKSILFPGHPQTSADFDQRMSALMRLRDRHPQLAWEVMLSMLPNQRATQLVHHGPEYRDWKTSEPVVTNVDYWRVVDEVSAALIGDAGDDIDRWVKLIEEVDSILIDRHADLRSQLERLSRAPLEEAGRQRIWEALRKFVSHHREYSDAGWALPAQVLAPFDAIASLFEPVQASVRHGWLFAGWVELGDLPRRDDFDAYKEELARRRRDAVGEIYSTGGLEDVLDFSDDRESPGQVGVALAQFTGADDHVSDLLRLLGGEADARSAVAFAFFGERFRSRGWEYIDQLLQDAPSATAAARLLRSTWSPLEAAERADRLGEDIADAFWREFAYFGLGHDFDKAVEVSRRLTSVGRYAAAVDLLALYARNSPSADYAVGAAEALEGLISGYESDPQASHLRPHDFGILLKLIAQHQDVVGRARATRIEWFFLPLLGVDPDAPNLHQALADDPSLFVELVSLVYRTESERDEEPPERSELERRAATNAFRLLHSWRRCPGVDAAGVMHGDRLSAWVSDARRLLEESDRLSVGDDEIGQVLVAAPADDEGWPCREVRDLLEELKNDRVDAGFARRVFNNRGATMRSLDAGGAQEWELVRKYRAQAAEMRPRWRRLARIFDGLADTYEADARREDAAAERRRRGLD